MSVYVSYWLSCTFWKTFPCSFPWKFTCHSLLLVFPDAFPVEAIRLIASTKFFEKRIGYLFLSVLLDEKDELLTLIPNSVNTDLTSPNNFVVSAALGAASSIADADSFRQLLPQIEVCLKHPHTYIRKMAVLCAVAAVKKDATFAEIFAPKVVALLGERSHAVVVSASSLLMVILNYNPDLLAPHAPVSFFSPSPSFIAHDLLPFVLLLSSLDNNANYGSCFAWINELCSHEAARDRWDHGPVPTSQPPAEHALPRHCLPRLCGADCRRPCPRRHTHLV
jgi:hypothetical protein